MNGNRRKKIIFGILTMIFSIILVMSLIYIIWYFITTNHGRQEYSKLQSQAAESSAAPESGQTPNAAGSESAVLPGETKINFETLQKKNPDIYAWIEVPGTRINYPVLQNATDDTYYLNHNLDGSVGYPACIYSQLVNAKDFSDFNTVLYGHNMKDGTMFHDLHLFEDDKFFSTNQNIYIYLPSKTLTYTVFAAYTFDDRNIMNSYDFSNESVRSQYLEDIKTVKDLSAQYRNDVQVTSTDKILTLSTCIGNQPDKRYLVQGVLTDEK